MNLELATAGLRTLAPHKTRDKILKPMRLVQNGRSQNAYELKVYHHAPSFVPAGQSTQMIVKTTPETDYQMLHVAETLYQQGLI